MPRTRLELVRFAPHAPQTCAATNYATSAYSLIVKNYLFALASAALFAEAATEGTAVGSTVVLAVEGTVAGVVCIAPSGVDCKTDTLPVIAGKDKSRAENIKIAAAVIVILDKTD